MKKVLEAQKWLNHHKTQTCQKQVGEERAFFFFKSWQKHEDTQTHEQQDTGCAQLKPQTGYCVDNQNKIMNYKSRAQN